MNARKADFQKITDQLSVLADKIDALQKEKASSRLLKNLVLERFS